MHKPRNIRQDFLCDTEIKLSDWILPSLVMMKLEVKAVQLCLRCLIDMQEGEGRRVEEETKKACCMPAHNFASASEGDVNPPTSSDFLGRVASHFSFCFIFHVAHSKKDRQSKLLHLKQDTDMTRRDRKCTCSV